LEYIIFYGNTHVDGNVFSYIADPVRILKGRIVAVSVLVIYSLTWDIYPDAGMLLLVTGVLLLPFLLVTATSFQMRNSAYCHIPFFFGRNYTAAYRMVIVPLGIVLLITWAGYAMLDYGTLLEDIQTGDGVKITKNDFLPSIFFMALMPVFPFIDYLRTKFIVNNTQFGQRKAEFGGRSRDFYKIYVIAFVLMMIVIALTIIVIVAMTFIYLQASEDADVTSMGKAPMLIVASLAIFYSFSFFISGYLRAARTNLIYEKTTFGDISTHSRLKTMRVGWIYLTNTVVIIFSLTLLVPWARVRMAKYMATCVELEAKGTDGIAAEKQQEFSAMGEEFVDAFDIDLGI